MVDRSSVFDAFEFRVKAIERSPARIDEWNRRGFRGGRRDLVVVRRRGDGPARAAGSVADRAGTLGARSAAIGRFGHDFGFSDALGEGVGRVDRRRSFRFGRREHA